MEKLPDILFIVVGTVMVLYPVVLVRFVNKYQVKFGGKKILNSVSDKKREDTTKKVITIQQIWTMFGGVFFIIFGLLGLLGIMTWRQ